MSQRDPEVDRDGAIGELSGDVVAAHHDGAIRVKVEAGVRLASAGGGTPAAAGEGGVALPVPSDADDGDARPAMGDSPLARRRDALDRRRAVSLLPRGRNSWDRQPGRGYPHPRWRGRGPRGVRRNSWDRSAASWSRLPPAVTVFGGGLGAAIEAGGDGSANVAHSVEVSESESDLESSPPAPTPAAPAPTAPAAPVDDGVRLGAGGALQ